MNDTIFALATARGKAGVAIVRVSGPKALEAAQAFGVKSLAARRASLQKLWADGSVLDDALVLYFEEGASFTGEEIVEFHVHGSQAVVSALLGFLGALQNFRLAQPGEFTRRALENGKLDLTQVEGLADLIDSETEAQRKQAQRVLSGAIGERAKVWRQDLIRAASLIEVTIDFADEDIPVDVVPEVQEIVDRLLSNFKREIDGGRISERVREGFEIAIIGAPNVGKSSLFNILAGREAAITSPIPGTTRDVIEVRLDIGGYPVTLLDTAGLRETDDEIERIGVERAKTRAVLADLRIVLLAPGEDETFLNLTPDDIVLWTKADLVPGPRAVSSVSGVGLDVLEAEIRDRLAHKVAGAGLLIRARQRNALSSAVESLASARQWLYSDLPALEMVAADLRSAAYSVEVLVGKIGVDTLLDEIFSSFCIGK